MKQPKILLFVMSLLSALILGELLYLSDYTLFSSAINANNEPQKDTPLAAYASQVIETCKDEYYRPGCYDISIPKLMDSISMEDAFQVTRMVQEKDSSYQYCHVLGHGLSAREVAKDPENWKGVMARCPSGVCSNGCIHGGFQERFREGSFNTEEVEKIVQELIGLCAPREDWDPTGLERGTCYHALGHLTMYITEADIPASLAMCDNITLEDSAFGYVPLCYDGTFMQIFQPLEPEDFALIEGMEPEKTEIEEFCLPYKDHAKASCISESWPLFFNDLQQDPSYVETFCGQVDTTHRFGCYMDIFYVMTAQLNFDQEKIINYCSGVSSKDAQGYCFANAASRLIETDYRNIDKSTSICKTAENYDQGEQCWQELLFYSSYNFHDGSPEQIQLCSQLPEKLKNRCTQ